MKLSNPVNTLVNIQWVQVISHNLLTINSNKSMSKDGKETKKYLIVSLYCSKYSNKKSILPNNIKDSQPTDC